LISFALTLLIVRAVSIVAIYFKTFHLCNTSGSHEHNAVLAVCNDCGVAEELKTKLFSKIIKHVKSKKKFDFSNFNLEITTTCKECNA
jgi:Fur family zinc uptake transcriptional regulator